MRILKRRIIFCILYILIIGVFPVLTGAAAEEAVDKNAILQSGQSAPSAAVDIFSQKISLDLRNIDILEALKYLSAKTGLNIVSTKSVAGRVTLTIENAPVKDIFDIMLRSNGLSFAKQGNIYNVMTDAEYKSLYGGSSFDSRQVKAFRLKYLDPEQAFALLDTLKSEIGRIMVDKAAGNVMIMDVPDRIEKIDKALEEFEKENPIKIVSLKYAKAKDIEEIFKSQLDYKKVGQIKADERNNQVIVQTLPGRMQEVERLIKDLDRQTKEVLIDTKIIKISLSNQVDTSFEWEGIFNVAQKYGMTYLGSYPFSAVQSATAAWRPRTQVLSDLSGKVGSYPFSGTTSNFSASSPVTPGKGMHLGIVDPKRDFDVFLKYLQTLGKTKIISNPKLVVVNNQEAKIHVGERQAYVTTTTTTGQTTNTISEEVTFVDVGIQFAVSPNINDDGYIIMKVKPEISSVTSILVTPTNNKIPIIDTSLTETTVLIKDGTTLIIGGLRKEQKTNTSSQVPFLGNIPVLGFFFKSSSAKTERTELLIMLTPHIISGTELTTGDERAFAQSPGKEYRDYQGITPPDSQEIKTKPYREVPEPEEEKLSIKETRNEP